VHRTHRKFLQLPHLVLLGKPIIKRITFLLASTSADAYIQARLRVIQPVPKAYQTYSEQVIFIT